MRLRRSDVLLCLLSLLSFRVVSSEVESGTSPPNDVKEEEEIKDENEDDDDYESDPQVLANNIAASLQATAETNGVLLCDLLDALLPQLQDAMDANSCAPSAPPSETPDSQIQLPNNETEKVDISPRKDDSQPDDPGTPIPQVQLPNKETDTSDDYVEPKPRPRKLKVKFSNRSYPTEGRIDYEQVKRDAMKRAVAQIRAVYRAEQKRKLLIAGGNDSRPIRHQGPKDLEKEYAEIHKTNKTKEKVGISARKGDSQPDDPGTPLSQIQLPNNETNSSDIYVKPKQRKSKLHLEFFKRPHYATGLVFTPEQERRIQFARLRKAAMKMAAEQLRALQIEDRRRREKNLEKVGISARKGDSQPDDPGTPLSQIQLPNNETNSSDSYVEPKPRESKEKVEFSNRAYKDFTDSLEHFNKIAEKVQRELQLKATIELFSKAAEKIQHELQLKEEEGLQKKHQEENERFKKEFAVLVQEMKDRAKGKVDPSATKETPIPQEQLPNKETDTSNGDVVAKPREPAMERMYQLLKEQMNRLGTGSADKPAEEIQSTNDSTPQIKPRSYEMQPLPSEEEQKYRIQPINFKIKPNPEYMGIRRGPDTEKTVKSTSKESNYKPRMGEPAESVVKPEVNPGIGKGDKTKPVEEVKCEQQDKDVLPKSRRH